MVGLVVIEPVRTGGDAVKVRDVVAIGGAGSAWASFADFLSNGIGGAAGMSGCVRVLTVGNDGDACRDGDGSRIFIKFFTVIDCEARVSFKIGLTGVGAGSVEDVRGGGGDRVVCKGASNFWERRGWVCGKGGGVDFGEIVRGCKGERGVSGASGASGLGKNVTCTVGDSSSGTRASGKKMMPAMIKACSKRLPRALTRNIFVSARCSGNVAVMIQFVSAIW